MISEYFQNILYKNKGYKPLDAKNYSQFNQFRPEGAKKHFCYVPFNGLTFCVSGKVYSCSYNRKALLGRFPDNTIKEIWFGETAEKLRKFHLHNDLSFGCQHCEFFFNHKKFTDLKSLAFDKYATSKANQYPTVLEFELSNNCNLECQMCSGENSSMIRKNREKLPPLKNHYNQDFIEQIKEFIPHIKEAKFYGGEPFLIPLHFQLWDLMLDMNPSIEFFIITNGTQWNERIEKLLKRGKFHMSVSIDSLQKERLERIRKNCNYQVIMENIDKINTIRKQNNAGLSLSFTLQKENWDELPEMIKFCNSIQATIFISYLENPSKYAISDLPVSELKIIKQHLTKHELCAKTSYEKHNRDSFNEFLIFLENLIIKRVDKGYQEMKSFQLLTNAYEVLRVVIDEYMKTIDLSNNEREKFNTKWSNFNSNFSKEESDKLATLLLNNDAEEAFTILNNVPNIELLERAKEAIGNYSFTKT